MKSNKNNRNREEKFSRIITGDTKEIIFMSSNELERVIEEKFYEVERIVNELKEHKEYEECWDMERKDYLCKIITKKRTEEVERVIKEVFFLLVFNTTFSEGVPYICGECVSFDEYFLRVNSRTLLFDTHIVPMYKLWIRKKMRFEKKPFQSEYEEIFRGVLNDHIQKGDIEPLTEEDLEEYLGILYLDCRKKIERIISDEIMKIKGFNYELPQKCLECVECVI